MDGTKLVREEAPQNYLLVEGSDDAHVFKSLFEYFQIPYEFRGLPKYNPPPKGLIKIIDKGGIENLLATLSTELKGSEERRLGIIIDADSDIAARWQAVRNKLVAFGYHAVPETPLPDGTIIDEEGPPLVGVWLMPNNKLPGMLEDFVSFLVPQGDTLWPMAEDIIQRVIEIDRRFPLAQRSKANIHTWLAWQEEPGKPMGQAITKRYLKAESTHAQQLMAWIHQVFKLEQI